MSDKKNLPLINPQILKGFRDALPQSEAPRQALMGRLKLLFESFGFQPIDTPALEYTEVLLGKGGGETDKQIYRFQDNGGRDVSLRFDLTVPFARFMAAHRNEVPLPFKRYHMAKVWRGENTQRGRFREFWQCDFDNVGTDSPGADWEILSVMVKAMENLKVGPFTIRLSHRGLFNRFLENLGITGATAQVLRSVDKLAKVGEAEVLRLLTEDLGESAARRVLDFIQPGRDYRDTLSRMVAAAGGPGEDSERLEIIGGLVEAFGWQDYFVLDPSITRGLDYYTGIVFETLLSDLPQIGSVCSGGRYNNLTGLYMKEALPGVGSSVGLDRLLAALDELQRQTGAEESSVPWILILNGDLARLGDYHLLAQDLRLAGYQCEVYPEARKTAVQYRYAEQKGIPLVLSLGQDQNLPGPFAIKNIRSGKSLDQAGIADIVSLWEEKGSL